MMDQHPVPETYGANWAYQAALNRWIGDLMDAPDAPGAANAERLREAEQFGRLTGLALIQGGRSARVDEPADLPPVGSWIGAVSITTGKLEGRVHQFIGWSPVGNLGLRCSRYRPPGPIFGAYSSRYPRSKLEVWDGPPAAACQKCLDPDRLSRS